MDDNNSHLPESDRQNEDKTDAKPFADTDARRRPNPPVGPPSAVGQVIQTREEFYSNEYKMDYPNRGKAIIINNKIFQPQTRLNDRNGTDVDASALACRFSELEFDVSLFHNQTAEQMVQIMKQVAREDHATSDCFACAILSHGEEGALWGTDRLISVQELLEPMKGNECLSLAGKPKLFFLQACRGTEFDEGVDMNVPDAIGFMEEDQPMTVQKIPAEADFLLAYSVVPGYYSWRNSSDGSWFVQALSAVLQQHGGEMDLLKMMTRVNQKVAYNFQSNTSNPSLSRKKQIPCVTSMLTKDLYFKRKS